MKLRLTRRGLLRWCWMRTLLPKLHVCFNPSQYLKVVEFNNSVWFDKTLLSYRPWNITEATWNQPGWRSHTGCQVLSATQSLYHTLRYYHWWLRKLKWVFFFYSRPMTQSGRPITGFVRPSTQSGRPGTMEQAIKTPRTASTARPVTSASGRFIRLGTVSKYDWNFVVL